MTKHKLANEMIISNGTRRSWKYRLRDLLILLVTWGGLVVSGAATLVQLSGDGGG